MATTIQNIELPKKPRARDTSGNNNHGKIYSGRGLEFDGGSYWFPKATRVKPDKIKSMKYGEYMVEEGDKPGNFVLRPSVVITSI